MQMKQNRILIGGFSLAAVLAGIVLLVAYPPTKARSSFSKENKEVNFPRFGIWLPPDYEVHGIDVSRYQGKINWEKVSEHVSNKVGISFAFIKASEGRTVKDNFFATNWKAAKSSNVLRGAYHFYRPHLTADEQFVLFRQLVKLEREHLPPVLYVQIKGSGSPAKLKKGVKRWLVLAEKHYGVTPILYTSYNFYKHYFNSPEFAKYPLWIAHYATDDLSRLTNKWDFWQHNESGRVKGISGEVDFNVYKGDYNDLLKLCKK